jgi:flavin reductase (DIM6/NTAB) family NADH-FMN oxidoreductase RutF
MWMTAERIQELDRFYRGNLMNSLTGFKSLSLLGSVDGQGVPNLAVFTQIFHIGADPPLVGVLFRPVTEGMHSLANLKQAGCFTLNHVPLGFEEKAHWTSARWTESEFGAVGFTPEYFPGFPAPFVAESPVRMGLRTADIIPIPLNGTTLVVGRVEHIFFPEDCQAADGFVNLAAAGILAGTGLDGYARVSEIRRFSYARPGRRPEPLSSGQDESGKA